MIQIYNLSYFNNTNNLLNFVETDTDNEKDIYH